jgi:predicted Zn finger-like uncharacterized protein
MKFVCERCQTKYSIADEKVRQKVLKIRCKTCENVITIRDAVVVTEPAAPRAEPPPAPAAAAGTRSVEWHLAVSGHQTGPFGLAALVTRILAADRNDEVYVWNEHLDGWKEPKQIPEVAAELRARAAAVEPPLPPVKRVPTPAGVGHHGRGGSAAPVVSRGGRSSGAMAAVAQFASPSAHGALEQQHGLQEGFEEKTQISPLDASLMLSDPSLAPTRGQPSLALLAKQDQKQAQKQAEKAEARRQHDKAEKPEKHEIRTGSNGHGAGGAGQRKTATGMPSGLEGLDFSPPQVAASAQPAPSALDLGAPLPASAAAAAAAAAKGVPVPVVGGSTSMLLSQVGARASRKRHPAVKFVIFGTVLAGLGGVIAVTMLNGGGDKLAKVEKGPAPSANPAVDPEAQARAEAEKYFKSMVGETKTAPAPVTKVVAPPAPPKRNNGGRNKGAEAVAPPSLAPPPVGGVPAPPTDGSRVTSRFSQDERRVAVPTKDRGGKAADEFDMQKFLAVFKQPDHLQSVKSCYERALKRDDNLKLARLDITVNVGETGSAKRVSIAAPPEFATVKSCIQDSVRRWRFPANVKEYEAVYTLILAGNSG